MSHQNDNQCAGPDWDEFRRLMSVTQKWSYFDHAAVAPLSRPAQNAINQWLRQAVEEGDTVWPQWASRVESIRSSAAKMIGAEPSEVAFVANTTTGISVIAEGLPWRDGDNVVTLAGEFPSNLYPWMNLASRGVETRIVEPAGFAVDLDQIADACDERTRLIAISWVGYATGWRIDVSELTCMAHERGILVFLDAIQGLGVFPLDVRATQIDFLAADGHKWLLGPEGAGLLFVRRDNLDTLRPIGVGWNSVVHAHDFSRIELNLRPEAARYEGGSQNMAGVHALGASIEMLMELGLSATDSPIAERVLQLNEMAASRLQEIGATIVGPQELQNRSGIVAFDLPGCDPNQVRRRCLEAGVALGVRGGRLRISPHAYVNEEDIEKLVGVLQSAR